VAETDPEILRERAQFGDRIRSLREDRKITQDRLSERSGVDRKTIVRIENATYPTDVDIVHRIARGLGVPASWLFSDSWRALHGPAAGGGAGSGEPPPDATSHPVGER
jgi:DNA-binding XRE family transcriptional regulator